jgi:hypothetical protein
MSLKPKNRLLVEGILIHEAETRHAVMFGDKVPDRIMSANEELWRAFSSKRYLLESESEMELANSEMIGLIKAHRDSCGDTEEENCRRLWRPLG